MQKVSKFRLAQLIGKQAQPSGKLYWTPNELEDVIAVVNRLKQKYGDEEFCFDNQMPFWLYTGVTAALAPSKVSMLGPNGPIDIPHVKPGGTGHPFKFHVVEMEEFTLVRFICPHNLGSAELLVQAAPPAVNPLKGVIVQTHALPWIVATVAAAYKDAVPWVANASKDNGAVVSITSVSWKKLGSIVVHQAVDQASRQISRKVVPQRGEIWKFDTGFGEHPGIIISTTERNAWSKDVLLVPMTTSDKYASLYLRAPASETGMERDSYAQTLSISKVNKHNLTRGPWSTVSESFMKEVTRRVRAAIGDADPNDPSTKAEVPSAEENDGEDTSS